MTKQARVLLLVLGVLIITWAVKVNYQERKARQTIVAYYIPRGYKGWVTIRYNVEGAPAIPFTPRDAGGTFKIMVPPSGVVQTSSPLYEDWHVTKYYWHDKKGDELFLEGGYGINPPVKESLKTWISSGAYNEFYLQFYVFPKPVPLRTQPPLQKPASVKTAPRKLTGKKP